MTRKQLEDLLELPPEKRLAIADALYESLENEWEALPLPEWQKRALDERLDDLAEGREGGRPATDVMEQLKDRLAQRGCSDASED